MPTDPYLSIPQPGPLAAGARLGKYQIGRRLGAGGMGAVYEAVHAEIGKRVAIKVLSPAVAAVPEARARFLREAQLTSKVRHPHAVDVTDMGTEGDQTFLVMELLDGEDLGARLERTGRMDAAALVDVVLPVCSAVAAAHAAGIIHRDLKPQNIFLARGVHGIVPKVLDFGISKGKEGALQALTGTDAVLGTPYYLAPEQVTDNRASSPASDQYAIGVVLYECLTGLRPFQADSLFSVLQKIVSGAPAPPRSHRRDLDPRLEAVVLRAMAVDPTRRYSSVSELARVLLPFASERGQMLWRDALGAGGAETVDDAGFRAPPSGPRPASAGDPGLRPVSSRPRPVSGGGPGLRPVSSRPGAASVPLTLPRSRAPLKLALVALAALGAGALWYTRGGGQDSSAGHVEKDAPATAVAPIPSRPVAPPPPAVEPPAPRSYLARVVVEPATARFTLDGRDAGRGPFERQFTADGTMHTLAVAADGFEEKTVSFLDVPPPSRIALVPRPPVARPPAAQPPRARPVARRHGGASPSPPAPREAKPVAGTNGVPVIE